MESYEAWQAKPIFDEGAAARERHGELAHLMFECYPAELLTQAQIDRASGILW